jgi:adenine-specific DNA-methyltransferase
LKNAYYLPTGQVGKNPTELETLPNIDINIKCGNSLVSRFDIDADIKQALKKSKWSIDSYRIAVDTYRNAESKEQKREMERLIADIKSDFRSEISLNDPKLNKLRKLSGELFQITKQTQLFEMSKKEKVAWNKKVEQLTADTKKLETEIEEIKANKIFENAFEWRFEFPEVLNDDGDFVGFDVVIGNPPYIKEYEGKHIFDGLRENEVYQGKMDIWYLFASDGINLLKPNGLLNYIAPNNWVTNSGASKFRNFILENAKIEQLIDFGSFMVFDTASIQTMIMLFKKEKANNYNFAFSKLNDNKPLINDAMSLLIRANSLKNILLEPTVIKEKLIDKNLTFNSNKVQVVLDIIASKSNFTLDEKHEVAQGIVPNPDVVNNKNILKLPISKVKEENIKVGDGVFVVDKGYFNNLSIFEKGYIKPIYEPYLISKYFLDEYDKEIIYITKKNFKNDAPKLILHLEKFKEIMDERRENELGKLSFNNLHWPRDSYFFEEGEKILCVRKCAIPTFAFTEQEAYVMMSFNVIRSNRINLKYLTGLLNSRLIEFWLKNKGKMQGNNYQIDKAPILDLPLINPIEDSQIAISSLVSKIIETKKQNSQADTTALETQIDQLVYQLYELTEEEIKIIEGE